MVVSLKKVNFRRNVGECYGSPRKEESIHSLKQGSRFIATLMMLCLCLPSCSRRPTRIDRTYEDGVEVVINHVEPYRIKGKGIAITLEEEFRIDTEREDLLAKGMGSAGEFDVDAAGNIFIVGFKNKEFFVNKFDKRGNLVLSFGRRGQGPGELDWPLGAHVFGSDGFALTDAYKKVLVYGSRGEVVFEERLPSAYMLAEILENGRYLTFGDKGVPGLDGSSLAVLSLCSPQWKAIQELDVYRWPSMEAQTRSLVPTFMWRVSGSRIYVANEARGYEIWIFGLDGKLLRKIRKEYTPVAPSDELKRAWLGSNYEQILLMGKDYFPPKMPPFNSFFTDERGRVFVMTYEPGPRPGEYLYDVFDPDGVFISRMSLKRVWAGIYLGAKYATVRNNRLYFYREKENGFHELVISTLSMK